MKFATHRPHLVAAIALLFALASAFADSLGGRAPNYVAPGFATPEPGAIVLLLHLPATESAYRDGDEPVRSAVERALLDRGYRIGWLDPADYGVALRAEFEALGKVTRQPTSQQLAVAEANALALVAQVACREVKSPLLIRTRLLTRVTEIWQTHASWDGVTRPIKFEGGKPGHVLAEMQGTGPGISIEAVAVNEEGRILLKRFGGVALPYYHSGREATPRLLAEPFTDSWAVVEGARIALSPFLGAARRADR